jgi:hypothetical protein
MPIIVKNEQQLKAAANQKQKEIVVIGDFADKIHKANQQAEAAKGIGVLGGAGVLVSLLLIPFTGGGSAIVGAGLTASAALTVTPGLIAAIAAAIGVSGGVVALILAVSKDYKEVEYSVGSLKMKLKK